MAGIISSWLGNKKELTHDELLEKIDLTKIPSHVAIIMDGNGRWAKKRGLPRTAGHYQGISPIKKVVAQAKKIGVKHITVYAFSTENWKRPADEVSCLMKILQEFLQKELKFMQEEKVRFNVLGDITRLPDFAIDEINKVREETKDNTVIQLNVALNYGGRDDIVRAVKKLAISLSEEEIENLTEERFSDFLYTSGINDPELLIRTSGEMRLSNFLLWQLAYSEMYITDVLWPDFNEEEFLKAILAYQKRDRRFGSVK